MDTLTSAVPQSAPTPTARRRGVASLRVALVTETYPPEVNGVARTLGRLTEGLLERGHRVQVTRPRQSADDLAKRHEGFEEMLAPGLPIPGYKGLRFGLPASNRLRKAWRAYQPEVIYIATEGPLGNSALKVAGELGIPAISGYHTNFDYYSRYYRLGLLQPAIRSYLQRFHNRSRRTLVPTRQLQQDLQERGFLNTTVLARGVDISLFKPARRKVELRARWGLKEDEIGVIHVGRMAPEKNLQLAAEAFYAFQARQPKARLILVGDGPSARELRRLGREFIFSGMRTGKDLAEHYASADIFLFPSTSETYGNVVPEAMASGLPVLGFDYAAAREHIVHGENGWLAPFNDARAFVQLAAEIADTPERIRSTGLQARLTAETLDWRQIHERFEDILHEHAQGRMT